MRNNFVMLLIPQISEEKKTWVSVANIVFIKSASEDHHCLIYVNEGNSLKEYRALVKMEDLLNMVNDVTPPRKW